MLVDITIIDNPIGNMIAELNKNMNHEIKIEKGIYELGHFNLEYSINDKTESYPELDNFNCYGVCDNYKQILEQCPELTQSKRNFVISITKIEKKNHEENKEIGNGKEERGKDESELMGKTLLFCA